MQLCYSPLYCRNSQIYSLNMSLKGWDTCIFSRRCHLTEEGEKLITRDFISSHLIKGHLLESSPLSIWTKWWTVLCRNAPFICNCPPDIRSGAVEDVILCVLHWLNSTWTPLMIRNLTGKNLNTYLYAILFVILLTCTCRMYLQAFMIN